MKREESNGNETKEKGVQEIGTKVLLVAFVATPRIGFHSPQTQETARSIGSSGRVKEIEVGGQAQLISAGKQQ